jgi:5'-nucleotidase
VADPARVETLVIAATNDLHGALLPIELQTRDEVPTPYRKGGLATLASYIRALRGEHGERFLLFDGGDHFQGSIESNSALGAPMIQFFNEIDVKAASIGNHEFDFGREALGDRLSEARFPYLAANIYQRGSRKPARLPNVRPHLLLRAGSVKVGVIGLTTRETPVSTFPTHVADLEFGDFVEATLREARVLREQGASVIVVLAHAGLRCENGEPLRTQLRAPTDPAGGCDPEAEITSFLQKIPPGTVDAVLSGHSHTVVHHWVRGVPVIQSGARGHFLHLVHLPIDRATGKVLAPEARIEGPIPICPEIFAHQRDCNGDRLAPEAGRGPLVPPRFLTRKIVPDPRVSALFAPYLERALGEKNRIVGYAQRPIEHPRDTESELGNLVADALRDSTGADFALMNWGGIRSGLQAGTIRYGDIFQALPFENGISVLTIDGKRLKKILRVAQSGTRGFFATSGLRLTVLDPGLPPLREDLDRNGRIERWELTRLLEASTREGKPILDNQTYRLATIDFLVLGGDDFGNAMQGITANQIQLAAGPVLRDAVVAYLQKVAASNGPQAGGLNGPDQPLVDPARPRLVFNKKEPPKRRTRRDRKRP